MLTMIALFLFQEHQKQTRTKWISKQVSRHLRKSKRSKRGKLPSISLISYGIKRFLEIWKPETSSRFKKWMFCSTHMNTGDTRISTNRLSTKSIKMENQRQQLDRIGTQQICLQTSKDLKWEAERKRRANNQISSESGVLCYHHHFMNFA